MKIELTTLSPLLSASGESSAHIDADVKYDKYGLPYLSGKTLKGLLRESTREVCEISGMSNTEEIVNFLFGRNGDTNGGILKFNNLKLLDYVAISKDLSVTTKLTPKFIQSYFTVFRTQTTINEDGIAKDKSLRTYRLIKKYETFEGLIENAENKYKSILEKAIYNLRYIGTRRNRGFGKIKIREVKEEQISSKPYLPGVRLDGDCKLTYILTTKCALQISKQIGDQNTVSTEDYILAQKIRGLIAELIIKNQDCAQDAHTNPLFKKIIFDCAIKYHNAFPYVNKLKYEPTPLVLGYIKTEKREERKIYNIFKSKNAKPIKGWFNIVGNEISTTEINTTSNFHSTRKNDRVAGRSTKSNGAIFYYESIEDEQSFKGEITGQFEDLYYIKTLLEETNGLHRIGKSKTAQYSLIEFSDLSIESINQEKTIEKNSTFYIVFQSQVIVYNEFGIAIPDEKYLQKELTSHNIKINKIASRNAIAENYMGIWRSKTNRENAFSIGTTLLVTATDPVDKNILLIDGIGERTSEGYGRITIIELEDEYKYSTPNDHKTEATQGPESSKVTEILAFYNKQEINNKIKSAAIAKSKEYQLNNNQIYRLKEKLKDCPTLKEWQDFLKNIKDKKSGKTIQNEYLWDSLLSLSIGINSIESIDTENKITSEARLYWDTFFNALRIKTKREKQ